jgi:hypothetical protein
MNPLKAKTSYIIERRGRHYHGFVWFAATLGYQNFAKDMFGLLPSQK